MPTVDDIWRLAEKHLVIFNADQYPDVLLWEHSVGVARAAVLIAALETVSARRPNPVVLTAAALFHDVHHVEAAAGKGFCESDCISRVGDAGHRERSAELVRERLHSFLDARTLDLTAKVVGQVGLREAEFVEAQIVGDADNLYQLGLMALWPTIRHSAISGKGIKELIEHSATRRTYGYWPARRSSFFFPEVRDLAQRRLETYERFVQDLNRELHAEDCREALSSRESGDRSPSKETADRGPVL